MKKAALIALALSASGALAAPALAQDHHDNAWTPNVEMRHGHHGYYDEHHHWRKVTVVTHEHHRGYWDHHHQWHDWNG